MTEYEYKVGDQVRITADVNAMEGTSIHYEDRQRVAGMVGTVREVVPPSVVAISGLRYRVNFDHIGDWWWFRDQDITPVSETTSDTPTDPATDTIPAAELERFKVRVAELARSLAREYGWCRVVDEALEELGIHPSRRKFTITATVEMPHHADALSLADDVRLKVTDLMETDEDWFSGRLENVEINEVE